MPSLAHGKKKRKSIAKKIMIPQGLLNLNCVSVCAFCWKLSLLPRFGKRKLCYIFIYASLTATIKRLKLLQSFTNVFKPSCDVY